MKKPDKTIRPEKAETADQTAQPSTPRKAAADPGVIASSPIPPGDGAAAAASAGEVKTVKSTLLGDGTGQHPPATRKPAALGETADMPQATPFETGKPNKDISSAERKDAPAKVGTEVGKDPAVRDDAAPARPASATPTTSSHAAPQVRKTGFWPVFLGGVVAAGLGSAATIWALPHLPAGWVPKDETQAAAPAPEIDVDAIRAEAAAAAEAAARSTAQATAQSTAESTAQSVVSRQIAVLREELAAQAQPAPAETNSAGSALAQAAPAGGSTGDAAPDQTAQAQAEPAPPEAPAVSAEEVAALRDQLDEQAAQIEDLMSRPQIDPAVAQRVETLAGQADTLEQQIQTAAQAAQEQINEAQAEAERLQQAAAETTRRAEAVAAIAALQSALDQGVTPDDARQALEGAGLETPEALTREVPSLDTLQAGFPEAARAALRTSLREESASGAGNPIANFLRAQTGARSVAPREGDDPDAVLSRANAAVEAGRIAEAVTEVETLPEPARTAPAMADWLAGATAYRDAQAALSDLSVPSN